jgi:16S rRNA (guanine527-N7)-methyltransferase
VTTTVAMNELDRADIAAASNEIFGDQLALAARYADFLVTAGIERGMIGPREADRVWERHLLNSAVLASLIPEGVVVVDLGSGAGLPGLPLAIARPDLSVILLEPMQRRVRFLTECLDVLGLSNVRVFHGRAESGLDQPADVVVARAVAELTNLVGLARDLLRPRGVLLALKGSNARDELTALQETGVDADLLTLPAPGSPARVVRVSRQAMTGGRR